MIHWHDEDDDESESPENQPIVVRKDLIRLPPRPCRLNRQPHSRELYKDDDEGETDPSNVYRMHHSDCIPTHHRPSDVVDCEPSTASSSELLNEVINQTSLHAALQSEVMLNAQAIELSLGPRLRLLLEDELTQVRRKEENDSNGIYYMLDYIKINTSSTSSDPLRRIRVSAPDQINFTNECQKAHQALVQLDLEANVDGSVELAIPSGGYGFSLGDGGTCRLIWKDDTLHLRCPAALREQFSNEDFRDPTTRHLSGWELMCLKKGEEKEKENKEKFVHKEDLILKFDDLSTRNEFLKDHPKIVKSSLKILPGYNPAREEEVVMFWYIRWICEPIKYSSYGTVEATVKLKSVLDVDYCWQVLEANGLAVSNTTRNRRFNDPIETRKLFIECGIPNWFSTQGMLIDLIGHILDANSIEYEDIYFVRMRNCPENVVSMRRELAKIRKRIYMAALDMRYPLHERINSRNIDLTDMYYFESAPYPWPFEVLPGRVLFAGPDPWSSDAEKRMDATGFPIDRRDDASAEVIWTDQEKAEVFTNYFSRITPDGCNWHMRKHDRNGARLTFGYRTTLYISKAIRIACDSELRDLDKDLRNRHYQYPEDGPPVKDELVKRERYWAQLIDENDDLFKSNDGDNATMLTVEGYPRELFDEALQQVKQILTGRTIDCSDMEKEGRLLYGFGARWLKNELRKSLMQRVVTDVDLMRKTLTIWGPADEVNRLIDNARHFSNHPDEFFVETEIAIIPPRFPDHTRPVLVKIGLEKISQITGGAKISTNGTNLRNWTALKFKGSIAQFDRLDNFLNELLEELPSFCGVLPDFSYVPHCPVCLTTITKAFYCLELCGHYYCLDCFANMVLDKVQSHNLSFVCLKPDCQHKIAVTDILRIILSPSNRIKSLDAVKLEPLLRSLKDSVAFGDTETMRVCPTPDCYGLIPFNPNDQPPGLPTSHQIKCVECNKYRCVGRNCLSRPHPGETCAQAETLRQNADESLKAYKRVVGEQNLKSCPSCTMLIEKDVGCNHMECTKCRIHFCWECGYQSKERAELYRHLGDAHGGFGGGWQIQGNQVLQAPLGEFVPNDMMGVVVFMEEMDEVAPAVWANWPGVNPNHVDAELFEAMFEDDFN